MNRAYGREPLRDAYTVLVSRLLFPLHERLKGHSSPAVLRSLEASQWWSAERLRELRVQRLRELLQHAAAHVPYYRRLFSGLGFDPRGLGALEDLAGLPMLDKAAIRGHYAELRSDRAPSLARFSTGGSSGEPLTFMIGKERVSHDIAAKWRATRWWGVDIGDPELVIWGSPIELGAQDGVRRLRDGMLRSHLLPAFRMAERDLDGFVEEIRRRRPRMLFGYPSALARIARHAESRGVRMDGLGVRAAFVTSERLYDDQRAGIARVFGCGVANGYGGRDAGFIAHECPAGGMHVTAEDIIVETVDGDGRPAPPGQAGEIVVTHLATRDYPFIRYRTGDVGVLTDRACPCGRGLPLLESVEGRTTDFIVAGDGTVMHGLALIYVLRELRGIASFKIVQESVDLIRVLIVPAPGMGENTHGAIRDGIRARLGGDIEVSVEEVPEIPAEASGKFRYVVSRIGFSR